MSEALVELGGAENRISRPFGTMVFSVAFPDVKTSGYCRRSRWDRDDVPEGLTENSPPFQRRDIEKQRAKVPMGRLTDLP